MSRKLLFLAALLLFKQLHSQSITGNIQSPQVAHVQDGIIVFGGTGEKSDRKFMAIKYDKDLNKVAEYSKNTDARQVKFEQRDNILYFTIGNILGLWDYSYLKLDDKLNELAFIEITKENRKENHNPPTASKPPFVGSGAIGINNGPNWKLNWKSDFDDDKIESVLTLAQDDKNAFVFINYKLSKDVYAQYVCCLNVSDWTMVYKTQINELEKNIFSPSNAIILGEKLYIIGNHAVLNKNSIYSLKSDRTPNGLSYGEKYYFISNFESVFITSLDIKTGKIINNKIVQYDAAISKNKAEIGDNDQLIIFHKLIANSSGQVEAVGECYFYKAMPSSMCYSWIPFAFVRYTFDQGLKEIAHSMNEKSILSGRKSFGEGAEYRYYNSMCNLNRCSTAPEASKYGTRFKLSDPSNMESYSYLDYLPGKADEGVLLFGNSIMTPPAPTFYVVNILPGGNAEEILIPSQKIKGDYNQCFLRDSSSVYLLTQEKYNKPFKLEIINF